MRILMSLYSMYTVYMYMYMYMYMILVQALKEPRKVHVHKLTVDTSIQPPLDIAQAEHC